MSPRDCKESAEQLFISIYRLLNSVTPIQIKHHPAVTSLTPRYSLSRERESFRSVVGYLLVGLLGAAFAILDR